MTNIWDSRRIIVPMCEPFLSWDGLTLRDWHRENIQRLLAIQFEYANRQYIRTIIERGTSVSEYDSMENVFEDDKVPGLSFKEAKKGQFVILEITRPAKLVQRKDYNTGEPAVYEDSGKPKMAGVFSGTVLEGSSEWPKSIEHDEMDNANPVGAERSFWVNKPSQPFRELVDLTGSKGLGRALRVGDVVKIVLFDLKKVENSKMKNPKPQKIYKFEILAEGPIQEANAFGSSASADDDEDPNS